ncbi:SPASM domain-containing protein [Chitinophaga sp. G-6-1-13]|uniref:SPASM domain-containing protein n=1 Tax=Chitinophaga fulva TaxID=2728842 RepID=A0A848GTN4_9BACT|nr:SPASM domain-containing protein [Chitinophaga fulva]NML40000.1 SPASM domain-containing protein [Chitinophaga fulva]
MMKLSRYISSTTMDGGDDAAEAPDRIIYSSVSNMTAVVNESIYDHLINGRFDLLDGTVRKELENAAILVPSERDELATVLRENNARYDNFSLMLNVSAGCQSGCTSCAPQQERKTMDDTVQTALKHYIERELRSAQFKAFNVIWNVGDPADDLSLITDLSAFNLAMADKYSVLFASAMICDGTALNRELFEQLFYGSGIRNFHIALDDRASQVFDNILDILENISFLPQHGVIFEIRINIDAFGEEAVLAVIDRFAAAGAQNRVTFQFGVTEGAERTAADMEELASFEIEYMLHALQKGFILGILPARAFVPCAAVDKGAATVDLSGNLFSCNALSSAGAAIQALNRLGNLTEGDRALSRDSKFRNWFHELENGDTACYSCNLLPVCGGGCRLKWEEGKNGCPAFKYNMEDRLVLSYLNQKMRMNELLIEED